MCNYIDSVKKFHETFNHPVNNFKDEIDLKTRKLRIKLIFEELEELSKASDVHEYFHDLCYDTVYDEYQERKSYKKNGNIVDKKEELDGLCDLQVVLSGSVISLGYQDVFESAFSEVQRSNMSKMCRTEQEVLDTQNRYLGESTESYSLKKGDGWIVLRKEDDKILKNKYYSEAQLDKFLE